MKFPKSVAVIFSGLCVAGLANSCSRGSPSSTTMTTAAVLSGKSLTKASAYLQAESGLGNGWAAEAPAVVTPAPGAHAAASSVSITAVSGLADSLVANTAENGCGFTIWSANSQRGAVAIAGRTYEAFDLGNPSDWTSTGSGLREGCSGGNVSELEVYWPYFDLTVAYNSGTTKVIRIATSDYGAYKKGDALIKVGSTFYWSDTGGSTLTAETASRPSSPYQITNFVSTLSYESQNGSTPVVGRLKGQPVDANGATASPSVSSTSRKVVVEFDFSGLAPAISDTSTDAKILTSFTATGITSFAAFPLKAKLTILTCTQIGTSADPSPSLAKSADNGCSSASPTPSASASSKIVLATD